MSKTTQPNDVANKLTTEKTFIVVETWNGDSGLADMSANTACRKKFASEVEAIAYARRHVAALDATTFETKENADACNGEIVYFTCYHHEGKGVKFDWGMDSGTFQIYLDESVERFGDEHLFGAVIDSGINEVKFLSKEAFEKDFEEALTFTLESGDREDYEAHADDLRKDFAEGRHTFLDVPDAPSHFVRLSR